MSSRRKKDDIHTLPVIGNPKQADCLAMFIAGWKLADISKESGVDYDTLKSWVFRYGWAEQKRKVESHRQKIDPIEEHPLVKAAMKNPKGEMREQFLQNTGVMAVQDSEHWKDMNPEDRLEVAPAIKALHDVHAKTFNIGKEEESGERGHINLLTFLNIADQPGMVRIIDDSKVREIVDDPMNDPAFS